MSHRIALRFEDGATRVIGCRPGERLADAAARQGLHLPLDCREGACGTCRCEVESGPVDRGDCIEDALPAADAAAGWALACQLRPLGDGVVRVPASAAACHGSPARLQVQLLRVRPMGPRMTAFTVGGPALRGFDFLPGQYARLRLPDGRTERAYSFSSLRRDAADGGPEVDFLVRQVDGGTFSGWLAQQARPGDTLQLQGPFGQFYLRPDTGPRLMLAGGTGVAPMLAMLERIAADGGLQAPCHLMLGVADDADAAIGEQLQDWTRRLSGFSWSLSVSDPAARSGRPGHVTDHLSLELLHGGRTALYVCGPPPMVDALHRWLERQPVRPAALHLERFTAA